VDDVAGDDVDGNGGDDTIIINGTVYFDVTGDCAGGDGGNDSIKINGSVDGDVLGDCVGGAGGDDTVTLGEDAVVGGVIDGEAGFDTLKFKKLKQSQLTGLDPAAGSITVGGKTYTWLNFESLIGLLAELVEQGNLHVYFSSNKLLAVDSDSGDGINVFAEHGRIAFIAFDALGGLEAGESPLTFQTPNSVGWFVTVTNLGPDVARPGHDTLLVRIFNAAGSPAGQFELSF
jgi:hypothetical protein